MSSKPGRNDPCPCNSGKKYKKCHGSTQYQDAERAAALSRLQTLHPTFRARHEAREFQRREQQGLGRPIISTQVQGHRVIAVGRKIHTSKTWRTFHDFLRDYPRIVLGDAWWMAEVAKAPTERHRIVAWAIRSHEQAAPLMKEKGQVVQLPATGAMSAFVHFAYDLYALQHAVEVQQLLIERIKNPQGVPGALYEVQVAAALLRAGFSLEFEDETDGRSTHVEFTATHLATGAKYSVEAKRRESIKLRINRLMHDALRKHAEHRRIVFVDTNDGRLEVHQREGLPLALAKARQLLHLYELDPVGQTLPEAYVIVTFSPDEHHLDAADLPFGLLLLGFRVDDMRPSLRTLVEQVEIRRRHAPVFALIESMHKHRNIPVTFDGEASAFVGGSPADRLRAGDRFLVPGPDGNETEVTLESGMVMPVQREAWCVVRSDDGKRFFVTVPLTEDELLAHKQHPQTFFGVVDRNEGRKPLVSAWDWFDFLWESYKDTPKEKLLEFMHTAPDLADLTALSQEALATQYCARMASSMWRDAEARAAQQRHEQQAKSDPAP